MDLYLAHGYSNVSVDDIAEAAGVSRTSFFRYFRSKSETLWHAFSDHAALIDESLTASDPAEPVMAAVCQAVVDAQAPSMDSLGTWMKRFRIVDRSPDLRGEVSERWDDLAQVITRFISHRTGLDSDGVLAQSVGGAVMYAYRAVLREWAEFPNPTEALVPSLAAALEPLCSALQGLLEESVSERWHGSAR